MLLVPDAAEGVPVATVDPLDTNCNDIDTSRPRLPEALYDLKIDKAEKKRTKAGDADMIEVVLKTTTEVTSVEGDKISPGFTINHYIICSEQPARKSKDGKKDLEPRTNKEIAEDIAKVVKSAGLNTNPRSVIANPVQLVGAVPRCNVVIQKATAEFPESNKISSFVVRK